MTAHAYLAASLLALTAVGYFGHAQLWDGFIAAALAAVALAWLAGLERQTQRRCCCRMVDLQGSHFYATPARLHSADICGEPTPALVERVTS